MSPRSQKAASSKDHPASRRERGVLAQRAYRKRHASKFQSLKEENERLRAAIAHIGITANGEGRFTSDLDASIAAARDVASAGDDGSDSGCPSAAVVPCTKESSGTASEEPSSVKGKMWNSTPGFRNIPTSSGIMMDGRTGMEPFAIPANNISYLGDMKHESLAGGIYRAVLSIAIRRWHDHFQQAGSHPPSHHNHTTIDNMIEPSLQQSNSNNTSPPNPLHAAFPLIQPLETGISVPPCIFSRPPSELAADHSPTCAHDVVKRCAINEPEGWWRAADGLEAYLRKEVLPPDALAAFEEAMRGGGTEEQVDFTKGMLEALSLNYKCFGDGPRWNAVYVKLAMEMFRKDLMGEEY